MHAYIVNICDINRYILAECPIITNKDGLFEADLESFKKDEANFRSIIVFANNFPYFLEPNMKHYLIFSLSELDNENIDAIINEQLKIKDEYIESVYWQNPTRLKSIKNFWHAHVLVRIKQ